jgi:hypothetical protein
MLQKQFIETPIITIATNVPQTLIGQDDRRVYVSFWNAPTAATTFISSSTSNFSQFSGKAPLLWGSAGNGPVWELWLEKCGKMVCQSWFIFPTGMPGTYAGSVFEWLEWDDGRDDGLIIPPFASDPHTLRTGIDIPDRMQQLVTDLLRMRAR